MECEGSGVLPNVQGWRHLFCLRIGCSAVCNSGNSSVNPTVLRFEGRTKSLVGTCMSNSDALSLLYGRNTRNQVQRGARASPCRFPERNFGLGNDELRCQLHVDQLSTDSHLRRFAASKSNAMRTVVQRRSSSCRMPHTSAKTLHIPSTNPSISRHH